MLTRQQVEDRATDAAAKAFEQRILTGAMPRSLAELRGMLTGAIAAYTAALWQPLGDGEGLPASPHEQLLCWGVGPAGAVVQHITTAHSIREALALPERNRPFWVTLISRWRFLDGPTP